MTACAWLLAAAGLSGFALGVTAALFFLGYRSDTEQE